MKFVALLVLISVNTSFADDTMFPELTSDDRDEAQIAQTVGATAEIAIAVAIILKGIKPAATPVNPGDKPVPEIPEATLNKILEDLRNFEAREAGLAARKAHLETTLELAESQKIEPAAAIEQIRTTMKRMPGGETFLKGWTGDLDALKAEISNVSRQLAELPSRSSALSEIIAKHGATKAFEAGLTRQSASVVSKLEGWRTGQADLLRQVPRHWARRLGIVSTLTGAALIVDALSRLGLLVADRDPGLTPAGRCLLELCSD